MTFDTNGSECPESCDVFCQEDHMWCDGGFDANECRMPNTCVPNTFGTDGAACPVSCPVICSEDQKLCDGGVDDNGCMIIDTCVANAGN